MPGSTTTIQHTRSITLKQFKFYRAATNHQFSSTPCDIKRGHCLARIDSRPGPRTILAIQNQPLPAITDSNICPLPPKVAVASIKILCTTCHELATASSVASEVTHHSE
ncbi:uncharacterized protein G2W53_041373 [Senna tora]|uniref:Uncharacterized protein n=1 Tax=Senna tora TaxID=362788 RepID=A0A834SJV8_9FABA|nr:uncharacterized protein G2W53_041373 [Senna tora]